MNFEYQLTELDEKYFLKERHQKTNLLYFILFSAFYIMINIPMMMKNFWLFFMICIFFVIVFAFILWGCNLIFTKIELRIRQKNRTEGYMKFHFSVTKRGITQSCQNLKKEVLWKDIKKIKIRKNYIFIEPKKDEVAFLFQRKILAEDFNKLIEIVKQNKIG